MSKPFKTLDEQITILKNRGMSFDDEEQVKTSLLCNNYYNVINYYSKFFMYPGTDTYLANVSFSEVLSVYYFDREIKSTFFKVTLDIEKCLKSLIAYYFSQSHPEDYAYLNVNNFDCSKITKTVRLISSISKTITRKEKEKNNNSVKHYLTKHFNVPLWVIINYFTFGQTLEFFELMKASERNKIAKTYSTFANEALNTTSIRLDSKTVLSYLRNIQEIRNITAHSNKFIGFNCKKNTPYLKELHSLYAIVPNIGRQDVYNIFIIMRIFLSSSNYSIFNNAVRKRMRVLSKKLSSIQANIIFNQLGFPTDWYQQPCI